MSDSTNILVVDAKAVAQVATAAIGRTVTPNGWSLQPLEHRIVNQASGGLFRISGTIQDGNSIESFSAILKIAVDPNRPSVIPGVSTRGGGLGDLRHHNYFLREYEAYRSGFIKRIDGVSAPRVYATELKPNGDAWLWIEDIAGIPGKDWPLATYGQAARHLARMSAAWFDRPLPSEPWFTDGFLHSWTGAADKNGTIDVLTTSAAWESPTFAKYFPAGTQQRLLAAWNERTERMAGLSELPSVICHFDAHARNLIARIQDGVEQTVALDWAFVGPGALGEDLAALVFGSAMPGANPNPRFSQDDLPDLAAVALEGYMRGLDDVGVAVDQRHIAFAFATHVGLRFLWFGVGQALRAVEREDVRAFLEEMNVCGFEEVLARTATRTSWLLDTFEGVH